MASVNWANSGTSGVWSSGPWTGLGGGEKYPGQSVADDVTIAGSSSSYAVTLDVGSLSLGSLTINNQSSHVTTLQGAGTIAVSGTISGSGAIGAGSTIGGTLDITGAGTLASGPTLALGSGPATTFDIDLAGGATSAKAISLTLSNQTLEVGPSGSLTINQAETVSLGQILMAGGRLTDSSGIVFGGFGTSGSMNGSGTIAATLSLSGNAGALGTIIASGGTLDLTKTFGAGLVAAIDSQSESDLKFDGAGQSNAAISLTSANQTLEIGSSGALTIGAPQTVTNGTIKMDGGTLTDTSGVTLGFGASLTGFGAFKPAFIGANSGTVTAIGGTLKLAGTIPVNSGLVFDIGNSAVSSLQLNASPGKGNTFTFLGSAGHLATASGATVKGAIVGLNVGSNSTPTNFVDILNNGSVTVTSADTGTGTTGTITLSNGDSLTLSGITNVSGPWHVLTTTDDAGTGTDVFLSMVCFAAGTRILTATGERVVEGLLQRDIVLTLADGELQAHSVKWIGRRRIDLTAHPRPETVAPIRIQRGAFADSMPHTDLLVSPDHAIFVDGKLICARQLVNGTTILQEQDWTSVDYYHVELDTHAILLAEGLPAESYLDTGNRGFFGNADEPLILHPDLTDEIDYPAREAGSCAPFVSEEAEVRPVWQRLAERAAALGQPVPQHETTTDPAPCLIARGRTVKPMYADNNLFIFALPKGATEVRLVSRAAAPTDVRPWLEDRRRLGLYVARIVLRSADDVRDIPVDHPHLSQGWWAVESGDSTLRRWTNGNAVLPLPEMAGPTMLEVRASSAGLNYPLRPAREVRAA